MSAGIVISNGVPTYRIVSSHRYLSNPLLKPELNAPVQFRCVWRRFTVVRMPASKAKIIPNKIIARSNDCGTVTRVREVAMAGNMKVPFIAQKTALRSGAGRHHPQPRARRRRTCRRGRGRGHRDLRLGTDRAARGILVGQMGRRPSFLLADHDRALRLTHSLIIGIRAAKERDPRCRRADINSCVPIVHGNCSPH